MTPEKEDIGEDPGSLDVDNVELTVMDDISSPESPHIISHSGNDNSSSDEEGDDSSGSEEERYVFTTVTDLIFTCAVLNLCSRSGRYILNTSSEGEHLLESPAQSQQQLPHNVSSPVP